MDISYKIRHNVEEFQTFIRDMSSWEKEMKRKENSLESEPTENMEIPPVRTKISRMNVGKSEEKRDNETESSKDMRQQALFEKERGNSFVKQKKWFAAIFHYTEAIKLFPDDSTFYTNRALCFLHIKKWKEAETDCTTALQIDPTYDKAFYRRALALKELNQNKAARDDFIEALRLNPNNSNIQIELTRLDRLLPNEVTESTHLETVKDKQQLARSKKDMGNGFVKKKDWKSAIECYTEACRLNPEDASFYLNRALCFLKTKEPKKTILDCIRVLELDPVNIKAYYRRSLAYNNLGDLNKAHDDLLAAFNIDPSNEDIQTSLNELEKRLGVLPELKTEQAGERLITDGVAQLEDGEQSTPKIRINGKRFTKLGGHVVKPVRKPAHSLSKKPLKKMEIGSKGETHDVTMARWLDALNTNSCIESITIEDNTPIKLPNSSVNFESVEKIRADDLEKYLNNVTAPKTAHQFMTTWNKLIPSNHFQYKYLQKIDGRNFPFIFKEALESHIFGEILQVLASQCEQSEVSVYHYLDGLSKVKRFSAMLLFASEEDKKNIIQLLDHCEKKQQAPEAELKDLRNRYC